MTRKERLEQDGPMKKNKNRLKNEADLRQKAEAVFLEQSAQHSKDLSSLSPGETHRMLHELRVHQIELEMQNDELRKAQESLDLSHARYLDLYDFAPVSYLTLSKQGLILEANLTASTMLGMTRDNLVRYPITQFILKEDQDIYYLFRNRLFETSEPQECELRIVKKDEATFWARLEATTVEGPDGMPTCRVVLSDITERKQVENRIKESEFQYRNLANAGVALIWTSKTDKLCNYFNDPWLNFTGRTLEQEMGNGWTEGVHPDDFDRCFDTYVTAFDKRVSFEMEYRLRHVSGKYMTILDLGTPNFNSNGEFIGYIGHCFDITERKQAEKNLNIAHDKILTILDSIDSTVYVADMDTREILFMNKKMIMDFGGDKTGEICFSAFRKKLEPCEFCTNDQLLDKNGNPAGVCTWHDKNPITGRFYINHDRAIEWVDGRMVRLQIATDITDLKKMEAQLTQAQKMESVGTLAGGIAHDFNNILFPLIGHAEMLLEDIPEDGSIRDSLNQIYSSSLRARDLVQQILAFARQEKNELKLMKMQPIVKEAMKLIRSTIPATINITQNIQPNCGPVIADPTQIHQIVMNLTTNAYHAMEENGGELKVSLREIELGENDLFNPDMSPGLYACLSIADTGMGMNKNVMNRIFDPFFTTKEKGKGTGMGLSTVHGIVKLMNGDIQVQSEPGKGAEFQVYLPVVGNISEKQGSQATEPIPGGCEKVLLVDDEETIIAMERQVLERLGYQVTSWTSSIEALEAFKAGPDKFDMVITDMSMPKMSGDKLAVELIKIRPDIPVLLCTGYSESMTEEKIKNIGIKGLLLKPIVIKDLAKKIREVLDSL